VSVVQQASSILASQEKDKKMMIRLTPDVHEELGKLVQYKGETYNDIVERLIKHYKATAQRK
jgi:predicted HicB family RNase H-like nuclease